MCAPLPSVAWHAHLPLLWRVMADTWGGSRGDAAARAAERCRQAHVCARHGPDPAAGNGLVLCASVRCRRVSQPRSVRAAEQQRTATCLECRWLIRLVVLCCSQGASCQLHCRGHGAVAAAAAVCRPSLSCVQLARESD
jgi:hypothetical protein